MSNLIVAIDGPSASGKSTVSRKVAAILHCVYVDSGSFYRTLTWKALQSGVMGAEQESVLAVMRSMGVEYFLADGAVGMRVDRVDPGQAIRAESVRENVSVVSAIPGVRAWMVGQLRGLQRFGDLVMEGRDIGTVVFPQTPFKFFLDANPGERARRRHLELAQVEGRSDLGQVQESLLQRDKRDRTRATAPLKIAADAVVIDTTGITIDEVVRRIVEGVRRDRDDKTTTIPAD